jgi:hydrogenase maturation protease
MPGTQPVDNNTAQGNPRIAVIGVGNILLRDEGIGVHIIQRLHKLLNLPEVELIDAGTSADVLMLISDSVKHVIVIDAATAGGKPGNIYRFTPEDVDTGGNLEVSLHQNSLVANLKMLEMFGKKPESVTIFGIEPAELESGLELSAEIEKKVPQLLELVNKEIANLID